ncbi:MAG: hypothetical protein ACRCT8_01935 [Lacipirellulaceae bacterium]
MAKKKAAGPNKSDAIRAVFKDKPKLGPKAVCEELKTQGIVVSSALVSNVKRADLLKAGKKTVRRGKPGRKPGRPPGAANDTVSLSALLVAREFAEKVGGIDKAEAILKTLGKLS